MKRIELIYILSIFLALQLCEEAYASSSEDSQDRKDCVHAVSLNVRPSYIIPSHGFYNGWNPMGRPLRVGGSLHAGYSFSYNKGTFWGDLYPGAYQGVGLGVQTLSSHEYIGTPVMLYLFQGSPIVNFSERLSLGYEWNLGLSGGWKPNEQRLTGSSFNVYVNVGLIFTWKISRNWDLTFGPEYTHFSNGDTRFPNAGANTLNLRMGARRYFDRGTYVVEKPALFSSTLKNFPFAERLTYDLTVFGGCRADRMVKDGRLHIINRNFPTAGIQFTPLYHFNHCLSAGPSLDILYDRSANLLASVDDDKVLTYTYPDFFSQCAVGLSVRGELKMPIFAVNIGVGYNICEKKSDLRGLYGVFALKSFVTDSLFLNVGYRLGTVLYAHNLTFGLGWRFGSVKG